MFTNIIGLSFILIMLRIATSLKAAPKDYFFYSHVRQFAKKYKESSEEMPPLRSDGGWVTIKLGDDDILKEFDMEKRILNAKRFESKNLNLKEKLFIDQLLEEEEDLYEDNPEKNESKAPKKTIKNVEDYFHTNDVPDDIKKLKGFLEMNPFICSGCGTPFQSSKIDNPGFLPKEKFVAHKLKAERIRLQQEAVRIIEIAGLDLDSAAAEEVLRSANIPDDVILGVKRLGKNMETASNNIENQMKINSLNESPPHVTEQNEMMASLLLPRSAKYKMTKKRFPPNADVNEIDQSSDITTNKDDKVISLDVKEEGVSEDDDSVCICQRCFRLQQYGQVEENLRPGWSTNELLTPKRFETLLSSIKNRSTVVLCIIDLFDINGSLLPNLKNIIGSNNPVIFAANKYDLLPKDVSHARVTNWVYQEIKRVCGYQSPRVFPFQDRSKPSSRSMNNNNNDSSISSSSSNRDVSREERSDRLEESFPILRSSNVHLVSFKSGYGLERLMSNVMTAARDHDKTVHVMGAANVGKSSFINRLLGPTGDNPSDGDTASNGNSRKRNGFNKKKNSRNVPLATVSNLPGTTLDFLKIKLPNGITLIDTPGLIQEGQLTSRLNTAELKQVIPDKPINAITLRLQEGKCVLMGGLAILEMTAGRPFFFTFFVSNEIKLHPTDIAKASTFVESHLGTLIYPPSSIERLEALQPFESFDFEIMGDGWKQSSYDIVIAGLGWIAVTGVGSVQVKVRVPSGTGVTLRPALLPYEATHSTAKFTGGRLSKKSGKSGSNTYGWRA